MPHGILIRILVEVSIAQETPHEDIHAGIHCLEETGPIKVSILSRGYRVSRCLEEVIYLIHERSDDAELEHILVLIRLLPSKLG
jgi:hypothetical protein